MKTNHKVAVGAVAGFGLGVFAVQVLHAQARPPAYTVAEVEVTDPETYKQYIAVGSHQPMGTLLRVEAAFTLSTDAAKADCHCAVAKP